MELLKRHFLTALCLLVLIGRSHIQVRASRADDYKTFGTLLIDGITFEKVIPNEHNYVLVMISHKGNIGKLSTDGVRDEFLATAESSDHMISQGSVLFTQVIVNGAQNKKLASRIGAKENFNYPSFHLYKPGSDISTPFYNPGDAENPSLSMIDVTRWLYRESGIYLGAHGTIDELDKLVAEFLSVPEMNVEERKAVFDKTRSACDKMDGAATSKQSEFALHYMKTMEKLMANPEYAKQEAARLQAIIESDRVSEDRKKEFRARSNILKRFL